MEVANVLPGQANGGTHWILSLALDGMPRSVAEDKPRKLHASQLAQRYCTARRPDCSMWNGSPWETSDRPLLAECLPR